MPEPQLPAGFQLTSDAPPNQLPAGFQLDNSKSGVMARSGNPFNPPKWYQPGGDALLDNVRNIGRIATNPEVVGGVAALATGGESVPIQMAAPALAAGIASVGRDVLNGAKPATVAIDAAGHAALNAIPAGLGWVADVLAKTPARVLPFLARIPGVSGSLAKTAQIGIDLVNGASRSVSPVAPAVTKAAEEGGGSFLHYLTGTAMVDATPAERMLLARQRAQIGEIASDKAAALAAEVAARTHALASEAASKLASAAAKRIAVIHAAVLAGHAALAAGSIAADSPEETK